MINAIPYRAVPNRQHGVALFVVLVAVMLSTLLALWASRTSLFNEMVVSNDADYQRAFEAAQALMQDAELDIRGEFAGGKSYQDPISAPSMHSASLTSAVEPRSTKFRSKPRR